MYYGATARKIRSYFKALRKAARKEGGAIGFIEEIDAIAMARGGMSATTPLRQPRVRRCMCCGGLEGLPMSYARRPRLSSCDQSSPVDSEGLGGVVNELLVQMQSFDEPTGWREAARPGSSTASTCCLPAHRQLRGRRRQPANILLIASTNRADNLDPALLRPGRFDRRLTFELPDEGRPPRADRPLPGAARRTTPSSTTTSARDALAAVTQGYTPGDDRAPASTRRWSTPCAAARPR